MDELNPGQEFDSFEPSALAICTHRDDITGMRDCTNLALLIITKSPLPEWETLIVERCPAHLLASWGVAAETPEDADSNYGWW